mmetsp:Transcript_23216/g.72543  ORF Transcript_23216/g.72543 Transcript_23216/m.72543 type:complete len:237 (-) Transcript_23216:21-731(-)
MIVPLRPSMTLSTTSCAHVLYMVSWLAFCRIWSYLKVRLSCWLLISPALWSFFNAIVTVFLSAWTSMPVDGFAVGLNRTYTLTALLPMAAAGGGDGSASRSPLIARAMGTSHILRACTLPTRAEVPSHLPSNPHGIRVRARPPAGHGRPGRGMPQGCGPLRPGCPTPLPRTSRPCGPRPMLGRGRRQRCEAGGAGCPPAPGAAALRHPLLRQGDGQEGKCAPPFCCPPLSNGAPRA